MNHFAMFATGLIFWMGPGLMAIQPAWAQEPEDFEQQIEKQLVTAGDNRARIERALSDVPGEQRQSMRFLVAWMTEADLQTLSADRLLENVALAHRVRSLAPWQQHIPDEIFYNHVLPHACLDEPRDPWRADFHERFWPWVKDCKTAAEAAQILNQKVFAEVGVKYSTGRRRANQSPKESIEQGLASCSGLSVILVDACRSVGVPARIAGIPKWANKQGNHTWVEIWDGEWHFTGAAEYDAQGLDRAWFTNDAAQADPESKLSSIYAVRYEPTGIHFPIPWNPRNNTIHAVNVTERYIRQKVALPEGFACVLFSAKDSSGRRVALQVRLSPRIADQQLIAGEEELRGKTRDESRDTNEFLELVLQKGQEFQITVTDGSDKQKTWLFRTDDQNQQMIAFDWPVPGGGRQN